MAYDPTDETEFPMVKVFIIHQLQNYPDSLVASDRFTTSPPKARVCIGLHSHEEDRDGAGLKDAHVQGLKRSGDSISTPCLCSFLRFGFIHFIDHGISPQGKGQGPGCPGPNALG